MTDILQGTACSLFHAPFGTVSLPSYDDHSKERERFLLNDYANEKRDHHKTHLSLELLYANNYLCLQDP